MEYKRASIFTLITSENYDEAKSSLDELKSELKGSKDLPDTLYAIASRYRWSNRHEEEGAIYQEMLDKYPDWEYASKLGPGLARTKVQVLIEAEEFDEAEDTLGKLVADFSEHPDLQDALYGVARSYSAANRYDDERYVYQLIIENNPDSSYASKAKVDITKTDVGYFIDEKDFEGADAAVEQMIKEHLRNNSVGRALYETAYSCCYVNGASILANALNLQKVTENFRKLW